MTQEVSPLAYPPEVAAELLGLSLTTMRRRIADGTIRASRVGRRRLVSRAELDRVLGVEPASSLPAEASGAGAATSSANPGSTR